ncbi:glycosyl transferase family 2 [Bythopirellula goksoeyrii]|uniref:Glycosyl transferase family 2 n=1 Tax=Bythopirellula goksoeyrii TaxID=1400387 RepID=A0A5B9QTJ6_9BACT|nr:glycosyl transferase family 2 [Bythopirellula goksoeyrii]QEG37243.1 hypothetical protein Pr1d_45840 [Bythopirellula goksoeyrii]
MHRSLSESDSDTLSQTAKAPHDKLSELGRVSVVIPVGPGDSSWRTLLGYLSQLPSEAEVWLVGTKAEPSDFTSLTSELGFSCNIEWFCTSVGRAHQMNTGAQLSKKDFLWFLHADSQFDNVVLTALNTSLTTSPEAVHFFDLQFQHDGPSMARLNAWGVWLRSHILKLPFGDQGLCMSRDTFDQLGRFPEDASYGEDHLLVWQAHRHRITLRAVSATLSTSARKYRSQGWLKTTSIHLWRTWAQAFPEFIALLRSRMR